MSHAALLRVLSAYQAAWLRSKSLAAPQMAADGGGAEQARIGIFLRLRPVARPSGRVVSSAEEGWVEFNVPRDATQG